MFKILCCKKKRALTRVLERKKKLGFDGLASHNLYEHRHRSRKQSWHPAETEKERTALNELSTHGYHQVNKLTGWKRRDMQSEEAD
jgi:hypothetical protein